MLFIFLILFNFYSNCANKPVKYYFSMHPVVQSGNKVVYVKVFTCKNCLMNRLSLKDGEKAMQDHICRSEDVAERKRLEKEVFEHASS